MLKKCLRACLILLALSSLIYITAFFAPRVSYANCNSADLTGDGVVNILDYSQLITHFFSGDTAYDLTGDNKVNIFDYAVLVESFFQTCDSSFPLQLEAENMQLSGMTVGAEADASGQHYLAVTSGQDTTTPQEEAGYSFNVDQAGTYYVWARVKGLTDSQDAFYVGINGEWIRSFPQKLAEYQWVLVQEAGFNLEAGQHRLSLSHGEVGTRIDLFWIHNSIGELPPSLTTETETTPTPSPSPSANPSPSPNLTPSPTPTPQTSVTPITTQATLAFPEAQGFGKAAFTSCNKSQMKVMPVTNLNNSGQGSLRNCVEASGPRICIFKTGGILEVDGELRPQNDCLYIAGQTAPGGGITLRNSYETIDATLDIFAKNVIVRGLSIRPGRVKPSETLDALRFNYDSRHGIADHVSIGWSMDETFSAVRTRNISLQWSLLAEPINAGHVENGVEQEHAYNLLTYAHAAEGDPTNTISIHHTIFAHSKSRNPQVTGGHVDFINNVIYNVANYGIFRSRHSDTWVNFESNYFKAGPIGSTSKAVALLQDEDYDLRMYSDGQSVMHTKDGASANLKLVSSQQEQYLSGSRLFGGSGVNKTSPSVAYNQALDGGTDAAKYGAGNSFGIQCDGSVYQRRDSVDQRVLQTIRSGTGGLIDHEDEVGGYPSLSSGSACPDADNDGLPDAFESRYGLVQGTDDAIADPDDDGYTNIEEYANGTNPRGAVKGAASSTPNDTETEEADQSFNQSFPARLFSQMKKAAHFLLLW